MPELQSAVLADYVRPEAGIAHVVAAGIDTVFAPSVPLGNNFGLLLVFRLTQDEAGITHEVNVIFRQRDSDEPIARLTATFQSTTTAGELPEDWRLSAVVGLNFGIPIPDYGFYVFEISFPDGPVVAELPLRVVPPLQP